MMVGALVGVVGTTLARGFAGSGCMVEEVMIGASERAK